MSKWMIVRYLKKIGIFKIKSISTVYKKNSYYDLIIKKEKILKTLENLNDEI